MLRTAITPASLAEELRVGKTMKIMQATILDATHVELSQPIAAQPGAVIVIAVLDAQEAEDVWRTAAQKHCFASYDDQDAIYDEL